MLVEKQQKLSKKKSKKCDRLDPRYSKKPELGTVENFYDIIFKTPHFMETRHLSFKHFHIFIEENIDKLNKSLTF